MREAPGGGSPDTGSGESGAPGGGSRDTGSGEPGALDGGSPNAESGEPGTPGGGSPDAGSGEPGTPGGGSPDTESGESRESGAPARTAEVMAGDLRLYDPEGALVGELNGYTIKRATRAALLAAVEGVKELLYEIVWRDRALAPGMPPADFLTAPSAVKAGSGPFTDYLAAEGVGAAERAALLEDLELLSRRYALATPGRARMERAAGAVVDSVELRQHLQVGAEHERLFRRLLEMLARSGVLEEKDGAFAVVVASGDPLPGDLPADAEAFAARMAARYAPRLERDRPVPPQRERAPRGAARTHGPADAAVQQRGADRGRPLHERRRWRAPRTGCSRTRSWPCFATCRPSGGCGCWRSGRARAPRPRRCCRSSRRDASTTPTRTSRPASSRRRNPASEAPRRRSSTGCWTSRTTRWSRASTPTATTWSSPPTCCTPPGTWRRRSPTAGRCSRRRASSWRWRTSAARAGWTSPSGSSTAGGGSPTTTARTMRSRAPPSGGGRWGTRTSGTSRCSGSTRPTRTRTRTGASSWRRDRWRSSRPPGCGCLPRTKAAWPRRWPRRWRRGTRPSCWPAGPRRTPSRRDVAQGWIPGIAGVPPAAGRRPANWRAVGTSTLPERATSPVRRLGYRVRRAQAHWSNASPGLRPVAGGTPAIPGVPRSKLRATASMTARGGIRTRASPESQTRSSKWSAESRGNPCCKDCPKTYHSPASSTSRPWTATARRRRPRRWRRTRSARRGARSRSCRASPTPTQCPRRACG